MKGAETLLCHHGDQHPPPKAAERLCDDGGNHRQGAFGKVDKTRLGLRQPFENFFFVLQISPFILNTVMNITAAMTSQRRDEQNREVAVETEDLWSVRNIYNCNFWFLGVDQAIEVTESFREDDGRNQGENFAAQVKVG